MLSRPVIAAAVNEYELLCGYVRSRQAVEPAARLLQLPKFPSKLTESMVGLLIDRELLLPNLGRQEVLVPGQDSDVEVRSVGRTYRVEVKGTAGAGFTLFYRKDCEADYLVWVDVSNLANGGSSISFHSVSNLGRFYAPNSKVTLPAFKQRVGTAATTLEARLADL